MPNIAVGYIYKRLPEAVTTGIYECNSGCKCSVKTCLNRVVQHPLSLRLQVFKTGVRGWGIRCLNDIPLGAFICIYAGRLLTEQVQIIMQNTHIILIYYLSFLSFIFFINITFYFIGRERRRQELR